MSTWSDEQRRVLAILNIPLWRLINRPSSSNARRLSELSLSEKLQRALVAAAGGANISQVEISDGDLDSSSTRRQLWRQLRALRRTAGQQ